MYLYSAFIVVRHTQGARVRITQCYLQITPYLSLPRKHSPDGASPDWGCGHLIAACYSFIYPKGWKAESAWLADLQRTVYQHKWSPVSRRSSAGQGKFACQRPTFYHCAMQPTRIDRILWANSSKFITLGQNMLQSKVNVDLHSASSLPKRRRWSLLTSRQPDPSLHCKTTVRLRWESTVGWSAADVAKYMSDATWWMLLNCLTTITII